MMIQEFEALTGLTPTLEEYEIIEERYYAFTGDKKHFCEDFKRSNGMLSVCRELCRRQQEAMSRLRDKAKEDGERIRELEHDVDRLEAALEREHGWQPWEDPHNVRQSSYEKLITDSCTRMLQDEEAAELIAEEFGFRKEAIRILHSVDRQEKDRNNRVRRSGEYVRHPIYNATDWNYIRFNVVGTVTMAYEMHNGELNPFWC